MGFSDEQFVRGEDRRNAALKQQMAKSAAEAELRANAVARAEAARLGYQGDVLADPAAAADWIENNPDYGTELTAPGWANSQQYAAAAKEYDPKGERSPTQVQHLMSPERYAYMQNVGRTVDLLRGLSNKEHTSTGETRAERAMHFWDQSNNARSTRDDYNDANYQRYGGGGKGVGALFTNPLSPIGAHLQNMEVIPNAIAFQAEVGPSIIEAPARAGALQGLRQRVALNENPMLDIDPRREGESPEQYAERYANRYGQLADLEAAAKQPSDQYVANTLFGSLFGDEHTAVPRFTADILGTARSMVDPTFLASVFTGAPVAAGRGGFLKGLLRATGDEAKPEAAFAAGVNALTGGSGSPTWYDYFFTPVDTSPAERASIRDQQSKASAQAQIDVLNRENPTIWESVHGKGVLSGLGMAENPQLWTGPQDDYSRARARR